MKLAMDFGTSYSAAAALVDGRVELVNFGDSQQFRTSVFFPTQLPSLSDFSLTAEIAQEIEQLVQHSRREQASAVQRANALREEAMRYAGSERERRLALIVEPRVRSDADMEREALEVARRAWLRRQTDVVLAGTAVLGDALYGEEAVDAYLSGQTGHLVSSPKSMRGFRMVGDAKAILSGVATQIISHIKSTAEVQFGHTFDALMMGRPVEFKSSQGRYGTEQALELLRTAAITAGFSEVEFLPEPAAASWNAHKASSARARSTLVVDIGGGTTDLAYGSIGGVDTRPSIEQSWGLPKGGTDIDIEFSMRCFMPAFGKSQHNIPNHVFYQASAVHDFVRQREFASADLSRYPSPYAERLAKLQAFGTTVRLNRAVERTKIALSDQVQARVGIDYIEPGLEVSTTREQLVGSCRLFLSELQDLITQALTRAPDVEVVYLTGGSSRAPFIIDAVRAAMGDRELVTGDASFAVVNGLAHAGWRALDD